MLFKSGQLLGGYCSFSHLQSSHGGTVETRAMRAEPHAPC